jgi:L-lactate dehydrogenase (cytochrome)
MEPASALEYRDRARRRLPHMLFEYLDGGSFAEVTLRRNLADLETIALRQRVLRDVSSLDLSTTLFGQRMALPVALGPIGLAGLYARRGEVQAAKAASAAGVPFCLSTVSGCSLEEVTAAVGHPIWFQLYMMRDRAFMRDLLRHVRELGSPVLIFTVDVPVPGARYRDQRSGLAAPQSMSRRLGRIAQLLARLPWVWDVGFRGRPHRLGNVASVLGGCSGGDDISGWVHRNFDPTVTFRDIDFIRSEWNGPLVIKGVLDPEDARELAALGADGIVVSNHGGRQLDGVPSSVRALPPIVEAVSERLTVLVDGGVRSGLDVVRMLALGAQGVLLGRAWAYALGAAGQAGVAHVLRIIQSEMSVAMALTGATRVDAIGRDLLVA